MKAVPDMVARWLPPHYLALGTDGFGRSDTRESLRIAVRDRPAAHRGRDDGVARRAAVRCPASKATKAIKELGIDPEKADPLAL